MYRSWWLGMRPTVTILSEESWHAFSLLFSVSSWVTLVPFCLADLLRLSFSPCSLSTTLRMAATTRSISATLWPPTVESWKTWWIKESKCVEKSIHRQALRSNWITHIYCVLGNIMGVWAQVHTIQLFQIRSHNIMVVILSTRKKTTQTWPGEYDMGKYYPRLHFFVETVILDPH